MDYLGRMSTTRTSSDGRSSGATAAGLCASRERPPRNDCARREASRDDLDERACAKTRGTHLRAHGDATARAPLRRSSHALLSVCVCERARASVRACVCVGGGQRRRRCTRRAEVRVGAYTRACVCVQACTCARACRSCLEAAVDGVRVGSVAFVAMLTPSGQRAAVNACYLPSRLALRAVCVCVCV